MPFSIIPFMLLFIPICEIGVFILVGGQIGVGYTLALILVTAIIGSILLRFQGLSLLSKIQNETRAGRMPGKELVSGVMILIAGILLLTPGFVTDTIGFLLFVPFVRTVIWAFIGSKISVSMAGSMQGSSSQGNAAGFGFNPPPRSSEGVVDLDADEYSEAPNPDTPWGTSNEDAPEDIKLSDRSTKDKSNNNN
ncbi:MAG: membrane protein FxsA [Rhizobiaceae bacterium]|nr:membrane protein FxsA [Rhizobiaceae bacterium]